MPTIKKARDLANAFEAAYPAELPDRLDWFRHVLGVDRVRLLRMMGMSPGEAKANKNQDWSSILQEPKWREGGWLVEGKLHELLSLFDYDWQALSERLHQPLDQAEEKKAVQRTPGKIVRLPYRPNGDDAELLLNIMAERGPRGLAALLAYLSESTNGTGHEA